MYRINVTRDDNHSTYWARDYGIDDWGNITFRTAETGERKVVSASCQWIVTEDPDTLPPAVKEAVSDSEEATG